MSIQALAEHYNAIQIKMGNADHTDWTRDIQDLFSENFTKTANGQVLVKNRSELQHQIMTCIEGAGLWSIQEKDIIPSKDGQKCTIRYIIITEKVGAFDVIAILSSENGQKIDSIDEVYYVMS